MREIKFRAWDNKEKKWLLGYEYPNLGGFSMFGETMLFEEWSGIINRFILQQRDRKPEDLILMQFTGLKDRLGKEIYEGDILCIIDEDDQLQYSVCEYGTHRRDMASGWTVDIQGFSFVKSDGFKSFPIVKNYAGGHDLEIIEVAGNIYQNPELLKQTP